MGKIIVSGASGQFGNAAARLLLERVPADDLILLSRSPEGLADLAEQGADVRRADFDDPLTPDIDSSKSNSDLMYGVGVGVTFLEHLNARLEYERSGPCMTRTISQWE